MSKNGQAKVLSNAELNTVLDEINCRRHPEKNTLMLQISFKLGLRVQEMSLLRIQEVAAYALETRPVTSYYSISIVVRAI